MNKAITILTKHSGHQDKPAIMINLSFNLGMVELIKNMVVSIKWRRALALVRGELT